jgi:putative flippase GtrA
MTTSHEPPPLPAQFLRFSIVGTLGFVVDSVVLMLLLSTTGLGFYLGRLASFLVAATFTWFCNRHFTFRDRRKSGRIRQWIRFVVVNSGGGLVNYGVYSALIMTSELSRSWPVLGVAAGSLAGLAVNFTASKYLVFRHSHSRTD